MLYNQIVNPITGRKVNINGNLGKKILSNYINYLNGGASKCANFHSDPIKCQSSRDELGNYCVYSASKFRGEVGQCRKSSARDIEKSKESARRRKTLEKKFLESAAIRVQRRYRSKKNVDRFADTAEDITRLNKHKKSKEMARKKVQKKQPGCKDLRKGKCRETKGCMLTKGKKKKCIPCDLDKYNTKDQCLYR